MHCIYINKITRPINKMGVGYLYVSVICLITQYSLVEGLCSIEDMISGCTYSVRCKLHSGSINNPNCHSDPYVKFIIQNTTSERLTSAFFGSTNFDSRVRDMKAVNNSWRHIEPNAFRYYTKTLYLDLSYNEIHIIEGHVFKDYVNLYTLNLSHNVIEDINSDNMFMGDTKDPELLSLDLSFNRIATLNADTFIRMLKLEYLYLHDNLISVMSEHSFNGLKSLKSLYLQYNSLQSLNLTLLDASSISYLDISYNAFTKISGYELNRLTFLKTVNISHSDIEIVEGNCFNQAFSLENIDLSYNKITSSIENFMFFNNKDLKQLNFYNNSISNIHDKAFAHNKLEYLNLENNNISGSITGNTFSGIKNITELNIYNQNITALQDFAFKDMEILQTLKISRNKIKDIGCSSFANLHNLQVIDLSNNFISNVCFFTDTLENVTVINLSKNNITTIPPKTFINQTSVKTLNLSDNNIFTVAQYSLPLNKLQYLYLRGNSLKGPIKKGMFSPAKYLRYLDLSDFFVTKVENNSFVDLPLLARLNLSSNNIEVFESNNFLDMNNMFSLDLSYNSISQLSFPNSSLSSLKALYLSNNKLNCLDHPFHNISQVIYLDVAYNNFVDVSKISFEDFPNVKVIIISHNQLKVFNSPRTNTLTKLVKLDLSANQLNSINLQYFKDIVEINVSNNSFTSINSTFFLGLQNLQALDISQNHISKIIPGTFLNAKALKALNLSNNHVNQLRYGSFRGLHNAESIDISNNYIQELDVNIFHECNELKRLIIDYNRLDRFDVEGLVSILPKLTTISLGGNPLSCKEIVKNIKNFNQTIIFRQVDVTSIHKIFHEDNVNGIRCGDLNETVASDDDFVDTTDSSFSTGNIFFILFCIAASAFFGGAFVLFYTKRFDSFNRGNVRGESRAQLRGSVELNGSEFNSDLLS
ncbi:toll-like receptor 6 [Plutella xylostella]|uniref:toll-like receptor 6 n=1 Tax=Plutella xylostella TaxID=51655 RepID=UPI002032C809|nr:toll-like receptor 6 [Plutella xylostella]